MFGNILKSVKGKGIILILYMLFAGIVYAADDGGVPGYFLNQNAGARALGMGGAYVSLANDTSSIYWNSAGLNLLSQNEIYVMHNMLFEGARYEFLGVGFPSYGGINLGLGFIQLFSDGGEETDASNNIIGAFSDVHNAFMLAVGYELGDNIFIGQNIKYIQESLAGDSRSAVSVDIGLMYKMSDVFRAGLNIKDAFIIPLQGSGLEIPVSVTAGLSYGFFNKVLIVSADADYSSKKDIKLHAGAEYSLLKNIALRGGWNAGRLTAGVGFKFDPMVIDYAMLNHELGLSHRIALSYKFGNKVRDEKVYGAEWKKKIKMAVMDLVGQNLPKTTSMLVSESLRNNLFLMGNYTVVERANMDKILKEQQFQATGCTTFECAVEVGKILNVDQIIVGSVGKLGDQYFISTRLVDVESGEIKVVAEEICPSVNELMESSKKITQKIDEGKEKEAEKARFKIADKKGKTQVAVMDLNAQNVSMGTGAVVSDFLRNSLFRTNEYIVLERANIDKVLKEQAFQLSGCTTTECAVEVGKLLNVKQVIVGSVGKIGDKYYLGVRVVDVETGEVVKTAEELCSTETQLANSCALIAKKLKRKQD